MRWIWVALFISALPCHAASYFISPTGSDAAAGTSTGTAWLSPNHALNCGDTITAAASTSYAATNFNQGKWGTVTCVGLNNVVWLQCVTFDACKISSSTNGIWVDKSFWGVQGWEVTCTATNTCACFQFTPNTTTLTSVHHVVFANDVANGCFNGGFSAYNQSSTASVDYVAYVGDIAYNAAKTSAVCTSGFNIYQPIASDTAPGTHMYIAGNFAWANLNPNPCNGGAPTDGEGINIDTFDGSQGGVTPYLQQTAVDNNITFFNGGRGIEVENNAAGSVHGRVFIRNNTAYGNNTDANQQFPTGLGDIYDFNSLNVEAFGSLVQTNSQYITGTTAKYALSVSTVDASVHFYNSYAAGVSGNDTFTFSVGSFAYGPNNTLGTNPTFVSPTNPGAPSCGAFASVPTCMAAVIASYTPTVTAALAYGRRAPSTVSAYDRLYPPWLCTVTLPAGLVTPGCATGQRLTGAVLNGTMR